MNLKTNESNALRDARLAGKVAIVTGAGSRGDGIGNGRAAAILLSRSGARVMLVDAMPEWLEVTAKMIRDEGGDCATLVADVAISDNCRQIAADTFGKWGQLDILVNNVGIDGPRGNAIDVDETEWDTAMRVNVTSMMLMVKHCVEKMQASGGGSIINVSSTSGLVGGHPALLYPTSKGAVVNMTRAMASHHGPFAIRVNCVAPGTVYTPMVAGAGMSEQAREARRNRSLLKSEGTGWDVGNAVRFLASDEARWITGSVLAVDGGALAGLPSMTPAPAGGFARPA